mmetsp:Transcript_14775/g.59148  ORF Transcript_14775/g.59148 Transcript_14775/m.59148 type:complete len:218 (-) Transcript_14775:1074-1727(-)
MQDSKAQVSPVPRTWQRALGKAATHAQSLEGSSFLCQTISELVQPTTTSLQVWHAAGHFCHATEPSSPGSTHRWTRASATQAQSLEGSPARYQSVESVQLSYSHTPHAKGHAAKAATSYDGFRLQRTPLNTPTQSQSLVVSWPKYHDGESPAHVDGHVSHVTRHRSQASVSSSPLTTHRVVVLVATHAQSFEGSSFLYQSDASTHSSSSSVDVSRQQ